MSRYSDGVTGVALLLMRFSCATAAFPALWQFEFTPTGWWLAAVPAALISLALVIGFVTRWTAVLLVFGLMASMVAAPTDLALLLVVCAGAAGALALLGPGAYSVDAHLVGRHVIRLDPAAPDRGSGQ